MRSDDLEAFTKQVEVLCAGFNVPPTDLRVEALWRGLQAMDLIMFSRVVECALAGGTERHVVEKMPTAPQLWNLSRSMRARAPSPAQRHDEPPRQFDHFHGFAQRALMVFLRERGGASGESLKRLVAEKNRVLADFRLIASEDVVTADEFREALFKAFARVYVEPSFDEVEMWREQTCRERGLHFVPRPRPAA